MGGTFRCPDCDRLLVVDWKAAAVEGVEAEAGAEGGLPAISASPKDDHI
jgi:hypothetical protein